MCGGYSTPESWQQIRFPFSVDNLIPFGTRRYGVRPFDVAPILLSPEESKIKLQSATWSLVPSWSKSKRTQYSTFNARFDKLQSSRVWQRPFMRQRCLVPADGFFERVPEAGSKKNRPFYIQFQDKRAFFFGGLWDEWVDPSTGEVHVSYTIITTQPNPLMEKIGHSRMPVILDPHCYEQWLDSKYTDTDSLLELISQPWAAHDLEASPVDYHINYRDRHGQALIEAIGPTVRPDPAH